VAGRATGPSLTVSVADQPIPGGLVDYYSRRANEYERIYRKPERQEDLRVLREVLAELLRGRDVLELACGTGYWTEAIAPAAASVLATDASAEVLEIARGKNFPTGKVAFQTADAYRLDQVPGTFDAALTGFWWSHVPSRRQREFLDVLEGRLSPAGRVVLMDNRYVEGSSTPIAERDAEGDTYQLRRLDDGSEHRVLKNFPEPAELLELPGRAAARVTLTLLRYFWCLAYDLGPR
jgi:demethylmenaquinone methyltransferase/2-methoxy-6-polyprenyl-1,4-benzoquinol methylase